MEFPVFMSEFTNKLLRSCDELPCSPKFLSSHEHVIHLMPDRFLKEMYTGLILSSTSFVPSGEHVWTNDNNDKWSQLLRLSACFCRRTVCVSVGGYPVASTVASTQALHLEEVVVGGVEGMCHVVKISSIVPVSCP